MDNCQKCGRIICQSGYRVRHGLYTCADCSYEEWKATHLAKYGRLWPIHLAWNNILNRVAVHKFSKTEVFTRFVEDLSNETGLFQLKYSEVVNVLRLNMEYTNLGGRVEISFGGFLEYGDASVVMIVDKFTIRLVKVVTIRGDHSKVGELTKSMTELLKSGVQFREVVCYC